MLKGNVKSIGLIVCFVLLSSIVFTACNTQGETESDNHNSGQDTTEKTQLTILMDNHTVMDGYEAVAAEIEERFNIETEFVLRPGGTEGDNVVKTRLATDSMEDIFFYNTGSKFNELNPEENLVDLTDEPYMDSIDDAFKQVVSGNDGKVYGVPAQATIIGAWLYNKKVYEELDLEIPKNWDELMANNEKIKEAGKVPVIQSYEDTWTSQLVVLADYYNVQAQEPEFAEEYTANKANFSTTPPALRSFEKLQELYEAEFINEDALSTNYDTALKMLAEGDGAHYPMLSQALPAIAENHPDHIDNIGIMPQPGDDASAHGLTVWMPASFYINNRSENVEAAKQWVEFFVSPEGMKIFSKHNKPEGPYVVQDAELPEDAYAAVKEAVTYFDNGNIAPALEFVSPVKGPNLEQITVSVGSGMMTGEEGAKEYDDDVVKQAQQLGLPGW